MKSTGGSIKQSGQHVGLTILSSTQTSSWICFMLVNNQVELGYLKDNLVLSTELIMDVIIQLHFVGYK